MKYNSYGGYGLTNKSTKVALTSITDDQTSVLANIHLVN